MSVIILDKEKGQGLLDHKSFELKHNFTQHPLLQLDSIKNLIEELPRHQVSSSSDDLNLKSDFEAFLRDKSRSLNFDEIIPSLMTSKSYIAVSGIEKHLSYKTLCDEITREAREVYLKSGKKVKIKGATFWLFIASPNAITPFHFDRFSNFIFQIRGSKELAVFPNFQDHIIDQKLCEQYCDGKIVHTPWSDDLDQFAHKYHFKSGDAVHIPFTSGHYVKNGAEDISISLSVFFHTKQTKNWSRTLRFNHRLRQRGILPANIGKNKMLDTMKAQLFPLVSIYSGIRNRLMT